MTLKAKFKWVQVGTSETPNHCQPFEWPLTELARWVHPVGSSNMSRSYGHARTTGEVELVEWDHSSFRVPKIISDSSPAAKKNQFYLKTVAAICDGGGSYATKAGALATCFAVGPLTLNTVKAAFATLYDPQK